MPHRPYQELERIVQLSKMIKIVSDVSNVSDVSDMSDVSMCQMCQMCQMSQMSQMSQTCLLITLIKCLKGHKSLGSLCSVVKTLIVSGNGPTNGRTMSPIELFWTAKNCDKRLIFFYCGTFFKTSLVRSCLPISLIEGRKSRGALLKGVQLGRWVGG